MIQQKSDKKLYPLSAFERLEALRTRNNSTWKQVADALDLSVAMLMMVKSGKRRLSGKALYRLVEVEQRAGIHAPEQTTMGELAMRPRTTPELQRHLQYLRRIYAEQKQSVANAQMHAREIKQWIAETERELARRAKKI